MRALVTGAGGFLGSNLSRQLLEDGHEVRALVREGSSLANLAGLPVGIAIGDLQDTDSLLRAADGCDVAFHTAALYSEGERDAQSIYRTNVDGTRNLLDVARRLGIERVVHTSTIGTIGRSRGRNLPDENTPFNLWDSSSHYVRSKYLAEKEALDANGRDLATVVVNPCAPVGPWDSRPSATGRRIVDYLRGVVPPYPRGGINFIHVRDVARGHILAAEKGQSGRRYILGYRNLFLDEFLGLMEKASGQPRPVMPRPGVRSILLGRRRRSKGRASGPPALTADCSRAVWELGLPQSPLEDAFREAVDWFREHGYADRRVEALA